MKVAVLADEALGLELLRLRVQVGLHVNRPGISDDSRACAELLPQLTGEQQRVLRTFLNKIRVVDVVLGDGVGQAAGDNGAPALDLSDDGTDIRQVGLVGEVWRSLAADDAIELVLCFLDSVRVLDHGLPPLSRVPISEAAPPTMMNVLMASAGCLNADSRRGTSGTPAVVSDPAAYCA
jgi:hypothetical protein